MLSARDYLVSFKKHMRVADDDFYEISNIPDAVLKQ